MAGDDFEFTSKEIYERSVLEWNVIKSRSGIEYTKMRSTTKKLALWMPLNPEIQTQGYWSQPSDG